MQNYFGHATINKNVRRTFKQNEALSKKKSKKIYIQCERENIFVCMPTNNAKRKWKEWKRQKTVRERRIKQKKLHASNLKKKYHKNIKQSATTPNRKHWGFHLPFVLVCFTPLKLEFLRDFLHSHTHYHPEHLVLFEQRMAEYGIAGEVGSMRLYHWLRHGHGHGHYHTSSHTSFVYTLPLHHSIALTLALLLLQSDSKKKLQQQQKSGGGQRG